MSLHKYIQSLHFPKKTWTLAEARQWVNGHKYRKARYIDDIDTHSFVVKEKTSHSRRLNAFSHSMGKAFWVIIDTHFLNPSVSGYSFLVPAEYKKIALRRWHQVLQYSHTLDDLKAIATRTGTVRLYHGCPSQFARALVEHGPRIPYAVEDTARHVAHIYGLTWMEFRPYAFRKYEVVERLSTSTAPIAARWAWSFALGEILTDLNSNARMLVAAKQLAKSKSMRLEDAYEEVHNRAGKLAKTQGIRCTFDPATATPAASNAPDILGLPNKFILEPRTGALVELLVDTRGISEYVVHNAQRELDIIQKEEETEQEVLMAWNHQYRDISIAASSIKSMRIVIDGMEQWEQEVIEEMLEKWGRTEEIPIN